jgi:hypothetical protein
MIRESGGALRASAGVCYRRLEKMKSDFIFGAARPR